MTEDMGVEIVINYCIECGCEFISETSCNICKDCKRKSKKKFEKINKKLIDEVKAADKLGLSYGKYKGRGIKL